MARDLILGTLRSENDGMKLVACFQSSAAYLPALFDAVAVAEAISKNLLAQGVSAKCFSGVDIQEARDAGKHALLVLDTAAMLQLDEICAEVRACCFLGRESSRTTHQYDGIQRS